MFDVDASGIPQMLEFSRATLPVFALPIKPGLWSIFGMSVSLPIISGGT
jgi:hypothetical protein